VKSWSGHLSEIRLENASPTPVVTDMVLEVTVICRQGWVYMERYGVHSYLSRHQGRSILEVHEEYYVNTQTVLNVHDIMNSISVFFFANFQQTSTLWELTGPLNV
jgi:hypothetical protein